MEKRLQTHTGTRFSTLYKKYQKAKKIPFGIFFRRSESYIANHEMSLTLSKLLLDFLARVLPSTVSTLPIFHPSVPKIREIRDSDNTILQSLIQTTDNS